MDRQLNSFCSARHPACIFLSTRDFWIAGVEGRFMSDLSTGPHDPSVTSDNGESDLIAFLNDVPVLAARLDADCHYQQANRTYVDMFGLTQQNILGKHIIEVMGPVGWSRIKPNIDIALTGKTVSYEVLVPFKQGQRFARVTYTPRLNASGAVIGFFVIALDVHEVVLAQRAAAQRADDLDLVLNHLPAIVASFDSHVRYLSLNRAYRLALNLDPERDYRGQSIRDVVGRDVWEIIEPHIEQALAGRPVDFNAVLTLSNGPRHVSVSYVPENSNPAHCKRYFVLIIDREKEYLDALAIRQSEEQLRTTLNSIGDAVISTDATGLVVRMNEVAERLTGWQHREAAGRHITDVMNIVHDIERTPVVNPIDAVMRTRRVVGPANHTLLLSRSGLEYEISESAAPILSEAGELNGMMVVFRDVSRENELQAQLRQSDKMQAIGQLAGGIAHNFNNLLGGVLGAAQLIELRAGDRLDAPCREYLRIIQTTALRASDLTEKLTSFARISKRSTAIIDVDAVVEDVTGMLRQTINKNITIVVRSDGALHRVNGSSIALQSAILNIGINAWHAMPDGGEITISLSRRLLTNLGGEWSSFKLHPGWFIEVSITDTGSGIPPEHLPRVFEPFFTTKAAGLGTGLGLATVYRTVLDKRGAVRVESELGRGGTFHLLLPEASVSPESENTVVQTSEHGPRQTVLLVDDEEALRGVLQAMLEALGYDVITAKDGQSAIATFRNKQHSIDLVITDMNMPAMNGGEIISQLRSIQPECRIIVSTGGTDSDANVALERSGGGMVLRKPFTIEDLEKAVSIALS